MAKTKNPRGNGEASYRQKEKNGPWEGRWSYINPETGRIVPVSRSGRTTAEAVKRIKEAQDRVEAGGPVRDSVRTLGAWTTQYCQTTLMACRNGPAAKSRDESLLRNHVVKNAIGVKPPVTSTGGSLAEREVRCLDSLEDHLGVKSLPGRSRS